MKKGNLKEVKCLASTYTGEGGQELDGVCACHSPTRGLVGVLWSHSSGPLSPGLIQAIFVSLRDFVELRAGSLFLAYEVLPLEPLCVLHSQGGPCILCSTHAAC